MSDRERLAAITSELDLIIEIISERGNNFESEEINRIKQIIKVYKDYFWVREN